MVVHGANNYGYARSGAKQTGASAAPKIYKYRTPDFEAKLLGVRAGKPFFQASNLNQMMEFNPANRNKVLSLIVDLINYAADEENLIDDVLQKKICELVRNVNIKGKKDLKQSGSDSDACLTYYQVFREIKGSWPAVAFFLRIISSDAARLDHFIVDLYQEKRGRVSAVAMRLARDLPDLFAVIAERLVELYVSHPEKIKFPFYKPDYMNELGAYDELTQAKILIGLHDKGDKYAEGTVKARGAGFWKQVFTRERISVEQGKRLIGLLDPAVRNELADDPLFKIGLHPALMLEFGKYSQYGSRSYDEYGKRASFTTPEAPREVETDPYQYLFKLGNREGDITVAEARRVFILFGLSENFSQEELKKVYRELIQMTHTDQFKDHRLQQLFNGAAGIINRAYDLLCGKRK